ncbi:SMP-30/gluconolactonase/LRE family protein [Nocardia brasiliensis]
MLDWAENLAYDRQGQLWVTRTARGVVERYDESGRRTAIVEALGPSGIRLGPDGLMYVYSVHLPTMLSGPQSVIRFDPADPNPQPEVFATGLLAPNGIVFDAEGYLYATDMWSGVIRIRPDGSIDHEWTARAKVLGSDGITVIDRDLYLNLLFSAGGQILRIPIDAPERRSVLTQLDPGPLPAGNDDLAVGRDGMLYVATGFGRLLRVDPATGNSCTLAALEPITAVAVAPDGNLMLSSESGNILRARV